MPSERKDFPGADGHLLSARLDLPDGNVKAYALFAHCFTCTKDVFAASRIAASLAEQGIAVLRFDFTGLGASEGEFANTNFSSNVQDLVAAADFMRAQLQAPKLIIGHSLGGAAVLAERPVPCDASVWRASRHHPQRWRSAGGVGGALVHHQAAISDRRR